MTTNLRIAVALAVSLAALSGVASAASSTDWTAKDMAAAARAVGYPKTGPLKLACRGAATFKCAATYRHHRRRVFYAHWESLGGWICAGTTAGSCKVLRKGFIPNAHVTMDVTGEALVASRGYMAIRYDTPQPYRGQGCPAKAPPTYMFCYAGSSGTTIAVNITMKKTKTGYLFTGGSTVQ